MITIPSDTLTETAREVSQNDLTPTSVSSHAGEGLFGTCGYSVSAHDAYRRAEIYRKP
jgi:hypothetical protein